MSRPQGGGGPNLTPERLEEMESVYDMIVGIHLARGVPAKLKDVAARLLMTKGEVSRYVKCLIRRGSLQSKTWHDGLISTNSLHTPQGLLHVFLVRRRRAVAKMPDMPYSTEEKAAIKRAQTVMAIDGKHKNRAILP